jgi:hypothetical protein
MTIRRRAAGDTDADDNINDVIAALDAILDQASALIQGVDLSTLPVDIGQACGLVVAAELVVDSLMGMLGIYDPDDAETAEPDKSLGAVTEFARRLGPRGDAVGA